MGGVADLERFLSRFDEPVAATARRCLASVRRLVPGATELVYDAYNALSISFATDEVLKSAFVAVVVYPRHVNVAFHRGAELDDPKHLLQGEGARIRHVRANDRAFGRDLASFVRRAAQAAGFRARSQPGQVIIKRVYARQRARRPANQR
jgi:hypothetical protein